MTSICLCDFLVTEMHLQWAWKLFSVEVLVDVGPGFVSRFPHNIAWQGVQNKKLTPSWLQWKRVSEAGMFAANWNGTF